MTEKTKVYVGMDVHKDSVVTAMLREGERDPLLVNQLSHDPRELRRVLNSHHMTCVSPRCSTMILPSTCWGATTKFGRHLRDRGLRRRRIQFGLGDMELL